MKKFEVKITDIDYGMLEGVGFSQVYEDSIRVYTFHNRYQIGNKHNYQHMVECINDNKKDCHIFSLYIYEHSGLAFSLEPFGDIWDSALFGCVCVSKEHSIIEATKIAGDVVKEANDIEEGAFVELRINELELCDCCNNIKSSEWIEGFIFNINNKEDKATALNTINYYIKDFNINDLDELIDNRYY